MYLGHMTYDTGGGQKGHIFRSRNIRGGNVPSLMRQRRPGNI